jgi:aspartate aminotransferase
MVVERNTLQLAGRIAALDDATRAYPRFQPGRSDTIDLAAGDPTFATPTDIARAGIDAIEGNDTKYTDTRGSAALRAAVRSKFERENGIHYADDQVIVGIGSKQILASALLATLSPGDEVVLLAPHYGVFTQMIVLADGRPVVVNARADRGFRIDPADLAAALSPRTAWVILNNPVNPTGVVYTRDELEAIVATVMAHPRAGILSDEIYEHLTFGETRPISPAALSKVAEQRTLTVNGVSKAYSMTGWRIGFGGGPARLIAGMARIQAATTSSASSISQAAALQALTGSQEEVESLRRRYAGLRDIAVRGLAAADYLVPIEPEAGLYVLADCRTAIGRRPPDDEPIADDVGLVEFIDRHAHVRTMPGSVFGLPGWMRLSFAVEEDTLRTALDRIRKALGVLR